MAQPFPVYRVDSGSAYERGVQHGTWEIVEGLTSLAALRHRRVRLAAPPLEVRGLTGCPVRAVARVDQ
jgi:kynurenine formamidase